MRQSFTIPGRLDGMNEYTDACRTFWAKGAAMKRQNQETAEWCIVGAHLKPHKGAVRIHYAFYEKPRRGKLRDKSNIQSFAVKVIEDALQNRGIIRNDSWDYVLGYSCNFFRVSENPRIEVEIEDA